MTEYDIPQERDLPAPRLAQLKDDLMAHIDEDLDPTPQTTPVIGRRHRWRRLAIAAAAVAVLGVAVMTTLGSNEPASANTAERTDDGAIIITLREGKHPKELERRLNDLGVPAVVDFVESGFGCDPARSTGWVSDQRIDSLFTWDPTSPEDESRYILHPDQLAPGETAVFVFQIDEHGDKIASNTSLGRSTTPVGPCTPVPDGSIVDAERGIAGG